MLLHAMCWLQMPAWPFVAASFGVGIFALLPYFAIWKPLKGQKAGQELPLPKEELVSRPSSLNSLRSIIQGSE